MKKYFTIKNMNAAILFFYIFAIFYAQSFCIVGHSLQMPVFLILLIAAYTITRFLQVKCQSVCLRSDNKILSKKETCIWTLGVFFFGFFVLGIYYLGFFPGSFSVDSNIQLAQAVSGKYSDWHPVLHTLLFFTLPMKLFHSEEMIVLLQIICFSMAFSWLTYTMRRAGCPAVICVVHILFVFMAPVTGIILIHPWKDCGFAVFAMLIMAQYIQIFLSEGCWLKKKRNVPAFAVCLAFALLMRHNAVLFVLPLLLSAAIHAKKSRKQMGAVIICLTVILIGFKGVVYPLLDVEKPDGRVRETVGICMAVMGNAVAGNPDALEPEVRDFLYDVASKEIWESHYSLGDYNSVKWVEGTDNERIDEAGAWNVLKYTVKTIRDCPNESLKAFFSLTGMIWKIDGDVPWLWSIDMSASQEKTDILVNEKLTDYVQGFLSAWNDICFKGILKYPFYFIGWMNLLLITLAMTKMQNLRQISYLLHALPALCYNFGTALLLTGFDWRFFYYIYPVIIPTVFLILHPNTRKEMSAENGR